MLTIMVVWIALAAAAVGFFSLLFRGAELVAAAHAPEPEGAETSPERDAPPAPSPQRGGATSALPERGAAPAPLPEPRSAPGPAPVRS